MLDKPIVWLGSARSDVREFPKEARQDVGFQLRRAQQGLSPTDWRPMSIIGPGVIEIRVHSDGEYRVFYVAKFREAAYVLYAFHKQTQKTQQREIEIAQRRFTELKHIQNKRKKK
jgi:phage-related protein